MVKRGFVMVGILLLTVVLIILSGVVSAVDPGFIPGTAGNTSYIINFQEDTLFQYNFTANVTNPNLDVLNFTIDRITSSIYGSQVNSFFSWISLNSTTGILKINATTDNRTGQYNITIWVRNPSGVGTSDIFYFNGTAVNDAPRFVNLTNRTAVATQNFSYFVNVTDEENNAVNFSVDFLSCNAPGRLNCSLFNIVNYTSLSGLISFNATNDDVGSYIVNITATDTGNPAKSTSQVVNFTVLAYNPSPILVSTCSNRASSNRTGVEDTLFVCLLNITDSNELNNITITSNETWFKFSNDANSIIVNTTSGIALANISFTPGDAQVGTWFINFTFTDTGNPTGRNSSIVNFTFENVVDVPSIEERVTADKSITWNNNLSINISADYTPHTLHFRVYDDDIFIPSGIEHLTAETTISGIGVNTSLLNFSCIDDGGSFDCASTFTPENRDLLNGNTTTEYNAIFNVTDAFGQNDSVAFNLTLLYVADPPQIIAPAADYVFNFTEGVQTNEPLFIVNHSAGTNLTYVFYLNNDLRVNESYYGNGTNYTLAFTPSYTDETYGELANLTLLIYGADNPSLSATRTWGANISHADAPVVEIPVNHGGSSGGSSTTKLTSVSLRLIMPDGIITDRVQNYTLPIILENNGQVALTGINLSINVTKDGLPIEGIDYSFDRPYIALINPSQNESVNLNLMIRTDSDGVYEIKVMAKVSNPNYLAEGSFYIIVREGKIVEDKLLFTEQLLVGNPVCAEVKELVDEAKIKLDNKDFSGAEEKLNEAVNGCRKLISNNRLTVVKSDRYNLWGYVGLTILASILLGILYYTYQRRRLIVN